jgi:serine/threonine protein kinase
MIGEILDGKYRIDQQLGAGGMGNVYLATHLGTTRVVAVKVIAPKWAADPHFLARFQREAQACGRLRHPNIVNVTDFGIAKTTGGLVPYLVMELLDGQTLSAFQRANPRPALPLVADLLDQVGLALAEAHQQGIVHRDLKPDNIWLEPNGRGGYTVKVLDFGVAKMNPLGAVEARQAAQAGSAGGSGEPVAAGEMETVVMHSDPQQAPGRAVAEESETVAMAQFPSDPSSGSFGSDASGQTMPGSLVGTPAYMSPEQALGQETDFRSDVYSLAVVAYSLVCGELPFPLWRTLASRPAEGRPGGEPKTWASAPNFAPGVPRDVAEAILAGLARDPAERPPSAIEFARRFRNAVDAEFLALRRSKAFLFQHFATFAFLVLPIYSMVVGLAAILAESGGRRHSGGVVRMVAASLVTAVLFVLSDNVLRATAALIALDEKVRVRRFISFRVFWKLVKTIPALMKTQAASVFSFDRGWVIGDCLWPVVCVAEKLSGKAAVQRSRSLMTGLNSAGRALAIRHLALAALALADVIQSIGVLLQGGHAGDKDVVVTAIWFPVFAVFAAAPLFLYDRTVAQEGGPLLQLDRTPEVRTTARPLSVSSMVWLAIGVLYLLYQPIKLWLFGS